MARQLYGFLKDIATEQAALYEADGKHVEVGRVSPRDKITLFVPGSEVSVFSAVLPARNENEARRAAPYAIEDEIAASVEDIHIALGPAPADTKNLRLLHVVANDAMDSFASLLSETPQIRGAKLIAEHSALMPGQAFQTDEYVIANIDGRSFCLENDMPQNLGSALLGDIDPVSVSKAELLQTLAENAAHTDNAIDLRQGVFRNRGGGEMPSLKQWRLSGGLAAALALAWGVHSALDISSMRRQHTQIDEAIAAAYSRALPDEPKPTNYVRAVSRAVNAQTGATAVAFRDAIAALYTALAEMPNAQLQALRYDREQGALVATISYAAYGDDTVLKNTLSTSGLAISLGDSRQERTGVVGDVTLRRGAL